MGILFLIGVYSIGGFFDPVTSGISLRAGQSQGYRVHFVCGFGQGEKQIYTGYDYYENQYEWKPFHWLNLELKLEHSFRTGWFQPYITAGVAYRDAAEWVSHYEWEPDTSYYVVEERIEKYQSAVAGLGVEIGYFKELAKGVPFIENISFQIEFPVIYYKFKDEVTGPVDDNDYNREHYHSGIGGGLGVHYNF